MSRNVLSFIKSATLKDVEKQMVLQCAPVMTGLKPSNLLIVQNGYVMQVKRLLENTNLLSIVLWNGENQAIIFIYDEVLLADTYRNIQVKEFLNQLGYGGLELSLALKKLASRYTNYRRGGLDFPHEMGIFLGYPVNDVIGYIENAGKNDLYTGYWKVYHNVEEAVALFEKFDQAREKLVELMFSGLTVREIMEVCYE